MENERQVQSGTQEDKTVRRMFVIALLATAVAGALTGEARAVSQAGGISLTFPIGARYNALGEAGTAASTDMTAMWWNLGAFAFASDNGSRRGLHFMTSPLAAGLASDVNLYFIGYGQHLEGWGEVGAYLTYLNQGEQIATDESSNQKGTFNSNQFAIGLAYGAKLTPQLGLGLGVKYFRDNLAPDWATKDNGSGSGSTWAVDLGACYKVMPNMAAGLTVTNVGPNITFIDADQSDPMPRTLRGGISYTPFHSDLTSVTGVADYYISLVKDDKTKVLGGGLEWGYQGSLFVRAGYKSDPEGDIRSFTAGGGVNLKRWVGTGLSFDYASVPQAKDLDRVHRFSLSFDF
jgi:hypothetical protein